VPQREDRTVPLTYHLRLEVFCEEAIRQPHTQHGGDGLEGWHGRSSLAGLALAATAGGDLGTLGECNGRQSPRQAHTSEFFPSSQRPSWTSHRELGKPGSLCEDYSSMLEAGAEAGFPSQRHVLGGTSTDPRARVTVR
jgi:hypothetical protein